MSEAVEVEIREAVPADAAELLKVLAEIGGQTPYLIMDSAGLEFTPEQMELNIQGFLESCNNLLLVAIIDGKIVGTASVKASFKGRMEHIGEIGISLLKTAWGFGLGTEMVTDIIEWAKENGIIRRLELTVQDRNQRAIHLYEKMGFVTECIMPRGAKTDDGEFLDVHLMRLLID